MLLSPPISRCQCLAAFPSFVSMFILPCACPVNMLAVLPTLVPMSILPCVCPVNLLAAWLTLVSTSILPCACHDNLLAALPTLVSMSILPCAGPCQSCGRFAEPCVNVHSALKVHAYPEQTMR